MPAYSAPCFFRSMALIIDLETVGQDFNGLDAATQDNLTRWARREAAGDQAKLNVLLADVRESLGFSPLTGEIAALGVYDDEKKQGVVYYQSPAAPGREFSLGSIVCKPRTEAAMLADFWRGATRYQSFVTFNGRTFDLPWLMVRSAVHRQRPPFNLLGRRYYRPEDRGRQQIDLLDQFTFYGAVRRRGSLHLYCRVFGIASTKDQGITGDDVARLFREQQYEQIAAYNSRDLLATAALFKIWQAYWPEENKRQAVGRREGWR